MSYSDDFDPATYNPNAGPSSKVVKPAGRSDDGTGTAEPAKPAHEDGGEDKVVKPAGRDADLGS